MDQLEEKEIMEESSNSKTLLTGLALFAAIIVLGLIFMPKPQKHFELSPEKMLGKIMTFDGVAGPEKVVDIIFSPSDKYRFIDLRPAPEYLKGHLPNAINIPVNHIFDKEHEKILKDKSTINLLYFSDHAGACGPWMILNQLGYENNLIVLGGYDYVNEYIINKFAPLSGNFKDEKAKFDYAKIISQTSGGNVGTANTSDKSSTAPIVKKKKEAKTSGGC